MSFELFTPIYWELLFACLLQGLAAGMIVAAYCYVMLKWVAKGKPGVQDFDET